MTKITQPHNEMVHSKVAGEEDVLQQATVIIDSRDPFPLRVNDQNIACISHPLSACYRSRRSLLRDLITLITICKVKSSHSIYRFRWICPAETPDLPSSKSHARTLLLIRAKESVQFRGSWWHFAKSWSFIVRGCYVANKFPSCLTALCWFNLLHRSLAFVLCTHPT